MKFIGLNGRRISLLVLVILPLLAFGCTSSSDDEKTDTPDPETPTEPERIPNNDADLLALSVQGGTLSPAFDKAQFNYNISLVNGVDTVSFLPVLSDTERFITERDDIPGCVDINSSETVIECARLLSNGSPITEDKYGSWVSYNVGSGASTTVTFEVIAESANPDPRQTYSIAVTREAETVDNANIYDLLLSTGSVNEAVAADTLNYTATVGFLTKQIRIKVVPRQFSSTVKVNTVEVSQGSFSQAIALVEGLNTLSIEIIAPDGTTSKSYSLDVTRQTLAQFVQQAYLKASNTGTGDSFGYSLAMEGDLLAVGAPYEDSAVGGIDGNEVSDCELDVDATNCAADSGAVYLFRNVAGSWSQEAYIKASYPRIGDRFGHKVELKEGSLLVSAPFQDAGGKTGLEVHDCSEESPENCVPDSGAIYEFTVMGDSWRQIAYLKAPAIIGGARFGWDLARDGDNLVIGSPFDSSDVVSPTQRIFQDTTALDSNVRSGQKAASGAVWVYIRNSGVWKWQAYVKADEINKDDLFGWSVDIQKENAQLNLSTTVAVGAPNTDDTIGANLGSVFVYSRSGSAWALQDTLTANVRCQEDLFGSSVALSYDTLAVGSPLEDGLAGDSEVTICDSKAGNSTGAVYLFELAGASWLSTDYLKASEVDDVDMFGLSLALDGDTLVVGAGFEDSEAAGVNGDAINNAFSDSGAAYVFTRASGTWTKQIYLKANPSGAGDRFGYGFALDGENIAISAIDEDSNATGVDGNKTDNSSFSSGAVYLFR